MVFHFTNHPKSIIEQRKWFFYYIDGQQKLSNFFAHLQIFIFWHNFDARVKILAKMDQNRLKFDIKWVLFCPRAQRFLSLVRISTRHGLVFLDNFFIYLENQFQQHDEIFKIDKVKSEGTSRHPQKWCQIFGHFGHFFMAQKSGNG